MPRNQTRIHGTNNRLDQLTGTSGGVGSNGMGRVAVWSSGVRLVVVGNKKPPIKSHFSCVCISYFLYFVLTVNIFPNNTLRLCCCHTYSLCRFFPFYVQLINKETNSFCFCGLESIWVFFLLQLAVRTHINEHGANVEKEKTKPVVVPVDTEGVCPSNSFSSLT